MSRQQRAKYFQQAKDGRYTLLCKTDAAAAAEMSKQESRVQQLNTIVDRLNQEFPHAQPTLRRATDQFNARYYDEQGST